MSESCWLADLLDVSRVAAGGGAGDGYAGVHGDHLGEDVKDGLGGKVSVKSDHIRLKCIPNIPWAQSCRRW